MKPLNQEGGGFVLPTVATINPARPRTGWLRRVATVLEHPPGHLARWTSAAAGRQDQAQRPGPDAALPWVPELGGGDRRPLTPQK